MELKPLRLVLSYLGPISLQVKTKKRNAMKALSIVINFKLSLKSKESFLIFSDLKIVYHTT